MADKAKPVAGGKTGPVGIMDTTLRDGHQSLFATRMRTEDMLEVAERLDKIGFAALEVWGGATFDVMHRFLAENPFDRIRLLKKVAPKTPFQMLLRGQNLVGYRNYADDLVEAFVKHSCDVGMDRFRVFDALNDPRNFEVAGKWIKKCGMHFQATICYTITERKIGGPIFNEDYYIKKVKELAALGADSIAIKDMAGMINPSDAELLVYLVKKHTGLPVQLHTHFTSGMGALAYLKATEAGVDIFDCALAPFAHRTSQPAVEPLLVTLEGHPRDPKLDLNAIAEIGDMLEKIAPKYRHFAASNTSAVIDVGVLIHQIPGGMTSNMINQLRQADALHRLPEVHEEVPRTRKELGFPPLVTPTSQIVGTQAVMNVLMGRYKMVSQEVKDLCYGLYGATPAPIDPEVQKTVLAGYPRGETPITGRPGDYLQPEVPAAIEKVAALYKEAGKTGEPDLDHVLVYGMYPRTGETLIRWLLGLDPKRPGEAPKTLEDVKREDELVKKALAGKLIEPKPKPDMGERARTFNVAVDGEVFEVQVESVGGDFVPVFSSVTPAAATAPRPAAPKPAPKTAPAPAAPAASVGDGQIGLAAPMPGTLLKYMVAEGDSVKEGQPVLTLEAMKMENQLPAPRAGKVVKLPLTPPSSVAKGDVLLILE